MQYQFVVMYDSRTEQWQVDVPSLGELSDRIMYDEEQQEWLYQGEPGYAVHESIYRDIEDELAKILAPHSLDNRVITNV